MSAGVTRVPTRFRKKSATAAHAYVGLDRVAIRRDDSSMPWLLRLVVVAGVVALAKNRKRTTPQRSVDPDAALAAEIPRLYESIGAVLGWQLPPLHFTTGVANAASDGRNIRMNLSWVRETLNKHCQDHGCAVAAVIGVLAHELTHHAYGDAHVPAEQWMERRTRERRADFNAGFVLARLGWDVGSLERVLGDPDLCCDVQHDPLWQRVATIREGAAVAYATAA